MAGLLDAPDLGQDAAAYFERTRSAHAQVDRCIQLSQENQAMLQALVNRH